MGPELRPCPFCGAKAYAVHCAFVFADHWEIQTECAEGCINYGIEPEFGTEEEAEKVWNRRAERTRRDAGERECPYCDREGARPIVLDESETGGRIRVGWIGGRPVLMAGTRRGYDVAARIRFCPMCARDLGGEG